MAMTAQDIWEAQQSLDAGIPVVYQLPSNVNEPLPFATNEGIIYSIPEKGMQPGRSVLQTMLNPGAGTPGLMEAALPAALTGGGMGLLVSALGKMGVNLPGWLVAALGAGAGAVGIGQALGLGEGGGLFGTNLLGGDDFELGGVPFGGPGLSEPLLPYKEWKIGNTQMYAVRKMNKNGKSTVHMFAYNTQKKTWKHWILKSHNAVIGKNMPRHQMITRLRRNLSRHSADARTILKLTSPKSLKQSRSRRGRR